MSHRLMKKRPMHLPQPPLFEGSVADILDKHSIAHETALGGADDYIISLAREKKCFVVSDDSDFFLCDVTLLSFGGCLTQ